MGATRRYHRGSAHRAQVAQLDSALEQDVPGLKYRRPPDNPHAATPPWPGRYLMQPPVTKGDDVRAWQQRMRDRGATIDVDGAYGRRSDKACRALQKETGQPVDGVVGPATWDAAFLPGG